MKNKKEDAQYKETMRRWASVGPYYAMFPTSFATSVIQEYTKPGECVFDPFAGRATSLFAAAAEGRSGIGIEINPVGWIYGKAKLLTAERKNVEARIYWIGTKAKDFHKSATKLPAFYHFCFSPKVQEFLLAARTLLDWRHKRTDWTVMALLLIDLHGKRENALSNQMRQTKSMSPQYAINWWSQRNLEPPDRDPVDFMMKKIEWRYAKGIIKSNTSQIYLGDCLSILKHLKKKQPNQNVKLLFTSPPYYGVTNYFYDQWLRLWLLGGPEKPISLGDRSKSKFSNKNHYFEMLFDAFARTKALMDPTAVVFVRTDARKYTRETTIEILERVFHNKKLRNETYSIPDFSQTTLFDADYKSKGEIDLVMW